jgi:hypothetical protein
MKRAIGLMILLFYGTMIAAPLGSFYGTLSTLQNYYLSFSSVTFALYENAPIEIGPVFLSERVDGLQNYCGISLNIPGTFYNFRGFFWVPYPSIGPTFLFSVYYPLSSTILTYFDVLNSYHSPYYVLWHEKAWLGINLFQEGFFGPFIGGEITSSIPGITTYTSLFGLAFLNEKCRAGMAIKCGKLDTYPLSGLEIWLEYRF